MTQIWIRPSYICMSHVTHMNESCHTYEWVMSHIRMSHVTHMHESYHTYEWVEASKKVSVSVGKGGGGVKQDEWERESKRTRARQGGRERQRERERERKIEREREREHERARKREPERLREWERKCVFVCVWERRRETQRAREVRRRRRMRRRMRRRRRKKRSLHWGRAELCSTARPWRFWQSPLEYCTRVNKSCDYVGALSGSSAGPLSVGPLNKGSSDTRRTCGWVVWLCEALKWVKCGALECGVLRLYIYICTHLQLYIHICTQKRGEEWIWVWGP